MFILDDSVRFQTVKVHYIFNILKPYFGVLLTK